MTRSANLKKALYGSLAGSALALLVACSGTDSPAGGNDRTNTSGGATTSGGANTSGGAATSGGFTATSGGFTSTSGGATTGGVSQGGAPNSNGGSAPGGSSGATGVSGGGSGSGGSSGAGGAAGNAGSSGHAGSGASSGGAAGAAGGGGTAGAAGATAGAAGAAGTGSSGEFDPCPASEPCKVLPLGDSITWGISYAGGYRIKLFAKAAADMKKMTFVGYDKGNPPSASVVSALGDASSLWTPNHEGHSGWTIQQDDELVLGTSKATNDGVNYTGKKVVADFMPNIVLVHLGTNDFRGDIAGAPDRLGKLIDHVVADAPDALVVVASVIPFPSGGAAVNTFNKAIPDVVKKRADAGKHVIFLDMFSALTSSDLSDGVHPNEGGYEKMAVAWYGAIKKYLH